MNGNINLKVFTLVLISMQDLERVKYILQIALLIQSSILLMLLYWLHHLRWRWLNINLDSISKH